MAKPTRIDQVIKPSRVASFMMVSVAIMPGGWSKVHAQAHRICMFQ